MLLRRAHPHDPAVAGLVGDGAAAAAVVADRIGLLEVPGPGLILELARRERAHRADLDALAAELAVQRPVEVGADARLRAAAGEGPLAHAVLLVADPDAFAAEDAAADVAFDDRALVDPAAGSPFQRRTGSGRARTRGPGPGAGIRPPCRRPGSRGDA